MADLSKHPDPNDPYRYGPPEQPVPGQPAYGNPGGQDPYYGPPPQYSGQQNPGQYPPPGQYPSQYPPPGQYGYGQPPMPQPGYGQYPAPSNGRTTPTGKQILAASWGLLKQDRELFLLPVLGAVFGIVAFLLLFVPGLVIGLNSPDHARPIIYVFAILGSFLSSIVAIFFQAALVIGAYQRADGGTPSLRGVLSVAWRMKGKIIAWALFTTVVGMVVRLVEQRLGILGRILGFVGALAWAVATFFALPVIVAEGLGPIDAVKKSAHTIRDIWGTSVRTTLRFGLIQFGLMIVPFVLVIVGIGVAGSGSLAGGVALAAIGVIALIGLGIVFGAIGTYARALIYRWTTGAPVPGIDPALFAGAFNPKRGRR